MNFLLWPRINILPFPRPISGDLGKFYSMDPPGLWKTYWDAGEGRGLPSSDTTFMARQFFREQEVACKDFQLWMHLCLYPGRKQNLLHGSVSCAAWDKTCPHWGNLNVQMVLEAGQHPLCPGREIPRSVEQCCLQETEFEPSVIGKFPVATLKRTKKLPSLFLVIYLFDPIYLKYYHFGKES